ncbi:MAG: tetratricopeptide repeat protein [Bacteroidales bacterium]|nr:tetratricopeptide repeat protein [Bacteroidales bacterium]
MEEKEKNTFNEQGTKNKEINETESSLTSFEKFIDKNKKIITYIFGGIIIIVLLYFIYRRNYLAPLEEQAHQEMFMAEIYFSKDSFKLALNGDGQYPGFLQIIEDYSSTKAGKLALYYAGICYLHLGDFESAIKYLKKFSTDDPMLYSVSKGAMGDAYLELGNKEQAEKYYKEAAYKYPNTLTSPFYLMKLGFIYEQMNKWDKALEVYEFIEKQYTKTPEGRKIEKFITKAKLMLNRKDL